MSRFISDLLNKLSYGYDPQGTSQDENQVNQHDTQDQIEKVQDSPSPINTAQDSSAVAEFPEIKNKPNRVPSRGVF